MRRVVYFDAGENLEKQLSANTIIKLKRISDFEIFQGSPETEEEAYDRLKDADAILLGRNISNDVIERCEKLKLISFVGYGVKSYIDTDFIRKRGITITNTPGYGDNAVAEHALTLLLSLSKKIVRNHNALKAGKWYQSDSSMEVKGKTIGLVGMGSIGIRMAELCKLLGMNVLCWTFNPSKERARKLGVTFVELDDLFRQSDFVSLHLPYTNETRGIIGDKEFSLMKQDSIFINTARAELVEEGSLLKNLMNKQIGWAGLDVFEQEPILENDPLLQMENVILSPHVGYNSPESINNMLEIAVDNIVEFFTGTPRNVY